MRLNATHICIGTYVHAHLRGREYLLIGKSVDRVANTIDTYVGTYGTIRMSRQSGPNSVARDLAIHNASSLLMECVQFLPK